MSYPVGARDKAANNPDLAVTQLRALDQCYVIIVALKGEGTTGKVVGTASIKWNITFYGKKYF